MKTIYKYPIEITDEQVIEMPLGANILNVQIQNDTVNIWAMVDPKEYAVPVKLRIFGTGNPVPSGLVLRYIGTVQAAGFVWHIFIDDTVCLSAVTKDYMNPAINPDGTIVMK